MTILSRNYYSRFVPFVKSRKRAAPPFGGAARHVSAQPEQRLHPQPELEFELEVPPTLPHEPQPHRRQHTQPVDVPATVPLCCVQVQVQVQVGFAVDVPPTEPVVCLQQGLQHRCWTKSGNVRPQKQPLQEEAILYPSKKDPGTSVPGSFYAPRPRTVPQQVEIARFLEGSTLAKIIFYKMLSCISIFCHTISRLCWCKAFILQLLNEPFL